MNFFCFINAHNACKVVDNMGKIKTLFCEEQRFWNILKQFKDFVATLGVNNKVFQWVSDSVVKIISRLLGDCIFFIFYKLLHLTIAIKTSLKLDLFYVSN